jgi:hypothetical protein
MVYIHKIFSIQKKRMKEVNIHSGQMDVTDGVAYSHRRALRKLGIKKLSLNVVGRK